MRYRSGSEWAGFLVAFVLGGAVVAFGVTLIGSFLGLPPIVIVALVIVALAVMVWPSLNATAAKDAAPTAPGVSDGSPSPLVNPAPSPVAVAAQPERTVMSDTPLVGIVMGSQSDMAVMEECAKTLDGFGVPYEVVVASAHRQPEKVHEWASGLAGRGVKVVIAAAGKAAHLGGVVAAFTPLPVITVPMKTSDLGGLDSLLSMVQMPSGVPVACVAINGAKNAAILATQVLGTSMPEYRAAIERMKAELTQ